jgi:anaerobic sulfite reductase subunit B
MLFSTTPYKITSKEKLTSDTHLFRVEKTGKGKKNKEKLSYEPGQFYQVSIPGVGEAPISVCSYSDEFIEFNIRAVGDVTDTLVKLEKGDELWLRGPYGTHYPMNEMLGKSLMIIGGGTGVAPLRGVIKYIEKHRADYDRVHLFIGFRSPEVIIFKKDIELWNRIFDLRLTVDKADTGYKGKVGLVTKIVEESGLNADNKAAIVCGPPAMIKFTVMALEKLGFSHSQIFVSHERRMKCGVGMCGHCMISGIYVCKDGPVFRYDQIKNLHE